MGDEWHMMRQRISEHIQKLYNELRSRVDKKKAAIQETSLRVRISDFMNL